MHTDPSRLKPIAPGTRPELAAQEARIAAARGRVSPLYQVLLNSPPIAHGWEQMLSAVRNHSSLSAAVRELVILRVAVLNRAPYEFDAHVPHAQAAGVSQAAIDATRRVPMAVDSPWRDDERVALELADAMTRDVEVPDALFARVEALFQGQQLLDLVATVAAYNMVSRLLVALRVGH
ncbi:carboxymuconolactone decarboxylase family protein [Hydrogenophaga sp. BPS33]|uniref:carboxymuconolactone decarboxylase family protein n=1 Tax=Hydrogenophaga sp. BPS33 TaxID=2651974 RepID=UPI00131F7130|nr:carboxymuconolactone decarboxylase family protein [Hydrogenophaga sp. BPS33]QHE84324.1 carboxymuconolactone decarboxylase family protein [Hydrogenophaga sp. BPS33]